MFNSDMFNGLGFIIAVGFIVVLLGVVVGIPWLVWWLWSNLQWVP